MSNCIMTIVNEFDQELDAPMLQAVLSQMAYHVPNARFIDIFTQPRVALDAEPYKHPGWLEWTIKITYNSSNTLTIGAIQRKPDAEYEFHS